MNLVLACSDELRCVTSCVTSPIRADTHDIFLIISPQGTLADFLSLSLAHAQLNPAGALFLSQDYGEHPGSVTHYLAETETWRRITSSEPTTCKARIKCAIAPATCRLLPIFDANACVLSSSAPYEQPFVYERATVLRGVVMQHDRLASHPYWYC